MFATLSKHSAMRYIGLQKRFELQPGEEVVLTCDEVLHVEDTGIQRVEILRSRTFGKCIFLDDKPQSSEVDHSIFNEVMVHVGMAVHANPEAIFIGGGGPGSCLKEALKYRSVTRATMCDIDAKAHRVYRAYLPEWHGSSFEDPRVSLHFMDARRYLEENEELFDVIIMDTPDPLQGSRCRFLYTEEFYRAARAKLKRGGIFISQAGRTNINNIEYHLCVLRTLSKVFKIVKSFERHIPFYGESWGFAFASDEIDPETLGKAEILSNLTRQGVAGLQHYSQDVHCALFCKSPVFVNLLRNYRKASRDRAPFWVL